MDNPGSSSGDRNRPKRKIKCFCGCSDLTEDEVKRIYRLSAQELLINLEARKLFETYLEKNRSGDKSEAKVNLDIYKKCDEFLKSDKILLTNDVDDLCECGLRFDFEEDLQDKVRTGDEFHINGCLLRIQGFCRNEIEISQDYKNFKQAILKKLQRART